MPFTRALLAALLVAAAAPALADDGVEICLLHATETLTARGRPHVFETELDCGRKPSPTQVAQQALVHNAMDTADALELMANAGYEVETASWRDSFTGRQILGVFTLVKGGEAPAVDAVPVPAAGEELPEAEEDEKDAEGADDASEPVEPER